MNIYIDESGSINNKNQAKFVISLIDVKENKKLKTAFKRFVSSNMKALKAADRNKMFKNGKFVELKGSCLNYDLKVKFVDFITRNHYFDVYYIEIDNQKLSDLQAANPSRVFNYTLKNTLEYLTANNIIPNEEIHLHIDERNEKAALRAHLEEYINTELNMESISDQNTTVTYYDSKALSNVQIADIFSNLYFSSFFNEKYVALLKKLENQSIIKHIYKFPL